VIQVGGGDPRIAVLIPCFNDGDYIRATVESIDEPEPVEVLVVDDGSTDAGTRRVLDRLADDGTKVIRRENGGVAAARMTGLGQTTAPFVFPLDADDLAVSGALTAMADRLDAERDAAVCYGDYEEFGGPMELVRAVPERVDPFRLAYTNEYPGLAMWQRSALVDLGGWKGMDIHEDWDLWMTVAERGLKAVHLGPGRPTFRRRVHVDRRGSMLRNRHRTIYQTLQSRHEELFGNLPELRRASDLSGTRKVLYPVVYGARPRLAFEGRMKTMLDRWGIWTQRR
jgi:glycosyltransferase involved in cell wall biosynthesis